MKLESLSQALDSTTLVSSTILPLHRRQQPNPNPLVQTENGARFEVEVQVNNQTFYLIPDTGSSDLWVPVSTFQCVEPLTNNEVAQEECHFGNTFQVPNTLEVVANQTFGVQYGTGIALGQVGLANVTLNGLTVADQKIGLVDRTNDVGDGVGSGVLGLGFAPLTSAHPGDELDNSTLLFDRAVYEPVLVGMYKQGLVEPWYSFAIERPPPNATSGPGGGGWVWPIEVTEGIPEVLTGGVRQITLMTLTVDGIAWSNSSRNSSITDATPFQAVVDTGNHMNLLPSTIAEAVNNAFNPPGVFDEESHVYIVDCDAKTPELGIILDGQTFWHQCPEDFIYHDLSGGCYSSIAPPAEGSGLTVNFLGDAFLRNVVSVYDFGKEEMRFAARVDGNSETLPPPAGDASLPRIPGWWMASAGLVVAFWC